MSDQLPHPPKAVIFDWDNTLVDSWGTIQTALNMTFDDFGLETWTLEQTKQRVARSMRDSFPILFGEDRWEQAKDSFYGHFQSIHLETLMPLAGAHDLLCALRDNGTYIGVVSNKNGDFLRKEADHLGWTPFLARLSVQPMPPRTNRHPTRCIWQWATLRRRNMRICGLLATAWSIFSARATSGRLQF